MDKREWGMEKENTVIKIKKAIAKSPSLFLFLFKFIEKALFCRT